MKTENEILQALATASTFQEQTALVAELDQVRATKAADLADERALQMSASIAQQTLQPVRVHERHTAATDWLGTVEASSDMADVQQRVIAEASMWYSGLDPMVRGDREEFREQATGMARRTASLIGGQTGADVPALAEGFLQYVSFLNGREAASGLPQVQQLVSPDGSSYAPTPLPEETFDTFQPPVAPENEGVDEMQSSENAEVFQEKMQSGMGGSAAPEVGDYHGLVPVSPAQDDDLEGGMGPLEGTGVTSSRRVWEEDPIGRPSLAVSAAFNLDDFKRAEATRAAQPRQPRQARRQRRVVAEVEKEGSSQLPQIQQVMDADGNYAPQPLPQDVAFPLTGEFAEEHTADEVPGYPDGGMSSARGRSQARGQNDARLASRQCSCKCGCTNGSDGKQECKDCRTAGHHGGKTSSVRKTADEFGASDAPHQTLRSTQTGADMVPQTGRGYQNGYSAGAEDARANERPTYADAGARNEQFQQGYSKGYSENRAGDSFPKDLPGSMVSGIPNNDANVQAPAVTMATALRTAASRTRQGASDFDKGFAYGRKWTTSTRSVSTGSQEFEAGLYAGMSQNPSRGDFVVASLRKGRRYPALARRVALHKAITQRTAAHPHSNNYFGDHPDYEEPGFPKQQQESPREADSGFASGGTDPRSHLENAHGIPAGKSYHPAGHEYYAPNVSNPGGFMQGREQTHGPKGSLASRRQAATSVDLDTMSPNSSPGPGGATPINGPGTPPPGSSDGLPPGAPGGAAPYNGAPPFGQPVAPDPGLAAPNAPQPVGEPMNEKALAFRRRVQSGLLASRQG